MQYMVVARAAEKLSWRRRTMTAAADHQPRVLKSRAYSGSYQMFSRQVKLLAPGQIPVFQRLPFRAIEALPKLRAPAMAEFGETARDHRRSVDSEVCPKIAQTLRTRRNFSSLRATASLGHTSTVKATR
jgi:hypothetical protein